MVREVSRVIHKTVLNITDEQDLVLPKNSVILSVGNQHENLCLWYGFDTNETEKVVRHICIFGTGNPIPDGDLGWFVGTVQMMEGRLVWHVFERGDAVAL